uniref:Uncharacterized protein n=1 Tax=Hucho hucho TaxID=62062 RepID=A0A4W5PER8_9TELE
FFTCFLQHLHKVLCCFSGIDSHFSHQSAFISRRQNMVIKGVYPSPSSWLFVIMAILATMYTCSDPSMGLVAKIQEHLPVSLSLSAQGQTTLSVLVFSTLLWLSLILTLRFCLKLLLYYHCWMFEQHGHISTTTKVWGWYVCYARDSGNLNEETLFVLLTLTLLFVFL